MMKRVVMPEQKQRSPIPMTITCSLCRQEQIVHIKAQTGTWSMAHQKVKCLKCEQCFDVMITDVIIAGPFLPTPPLDD
jgi:ribosomal protein S27E